jgi:taurine--2-oxoglutarate transaminase
MTGWFRTGKPFAINHWGVTPDILTMAKGATSAYTPCGITATTRKIADHFEDNLFNHGHTYAYHPLVLSVIPAAVSEYKRLIESGLMKKASKYLKESLYKLADKHECIGDVRGIGHFWGLELVKNRKTKEPFNIKSDVYAVNGPMMTAKVAGECMKNGLWIMSWYDALMIAPPLIIDQEQIAEGMHILDKALALADEEVESTGIEVSKSSEFHN